MRIPPSLIALIGCLILTLNSHLLFAEEVNESIVTPHQVELNDPESVPQKKVVLELLSQVDLIKNNINQEQYSIGISRVTQLLDRLKARRHAIIGEFFPAKLDHFKLQSRDEMFDETGIMTGSGQVFACTYLNQAGHSIDVFVIHLDPAIKDYKNIIQNPSLITGSENTQIIELSGGFYGLEKKSEEGRFVEQNILINDELLLNLVANGVEEDAVLNKLYTQINVTGLDTYLNTH